MKELQHVVIDTNFFINDPDLRSAAWGDLRTAQEEGRIKLYIPEIVVREQVRHRVDPLHRDLDKGLVDFIRGHRELTRRGISVPEIDIAALRSQRRGLVVTSDYESAFRKELRDSGANVLPLPPLDVEDLVQRYLHGQKPFKENGDGVADYIIWRSVVDLHDAMPASEVIVVITKNTKDFIENGVVHPHLALDVDPTRMRWFPHPNDFIRELTLALPKLVSPRFYATSVISNERTPDHALAFEAAEIYASGPLLFSQITIDEDSYGDLEILGYAPHPIFQSPTIEGVDLDPSEASWWPYEEYEDGTVLGRLEAPGLLQIAGFANKSDLAVYDDVHVVHGDHNDHMSEVGEELAVVIEFHVRVSGEEAEVLNIETIELVPSGAGKRSII